MLRPWSRNALSSELRAATIVQVKVDQTDKEEEARVTESLKPGEFDSSFSAVDSKDLPGEYISVFQQDS